MTDLSAVLNMVPVADIAKKLGIPEDVADAAVKQVHPGLVGGLAANASSASGTASNAQSVVGGLLGGLLGGGKR